MEETTPKRALVLFSGGLDSTTCLYYAKKKGFHVKALSFDYGQRHQIELVRAQKIAQNVADLGHTTIRLDFSAFAEASALTNFKLDIPLGGTHLDQQDFIPITYVPARNLIFLSYGVAVAEAENISKILIGANARDYSGYPDCRPDFLQAFAHAASLATARGRQSSPIEIETPLLFLSKKEIVEMALSLGVPIEETWSCYNPQPSVSGELKPCGQCDSCLLRQRALAELGIREL
ncbi:MAG: 7-cyano-7-deazaguanine synthase QueC [Leptospiraceae bacterium]|nr:7-cyano-7-deazaguanine synthase QueC [Leptospiraceae bacterium]MDW8307699.1 7-cyano-7-deazaguanine synthase QueC [Leptospiraceae bacterium]